MIWHPIWLQDFYPRSPCGERHSEAVPRRPDADISIHALLAESDANNVLPAYAACGISIHALLAESDNHGKRGTAKSQDFYPRSPCGERLDLQTLQQYRFVFLSTLSLRRATAGYRQALAHCNISIHALLAESDTSRLHKILADWDFYPRSPCGERHLNLDWIIKALTISIHALLAESDHTDVSTIFRG